jgi:hypothetical protein
MKSPSVKSPKRRQSAGTIFITASKVSGVPAGKYYAAFKKGETNFIYSTSGDMIPLDKSAFQWEVMDRVVMVVKAMSSHLDSIKPGGIYRVFDDTSNDERYIFDDNREKVLFDENIFTWEVV